MPAYARDIIDTIERQKQTCHDFFTVVHKVYERSCDVLLLNPRNARPHLVALHTSRRILQAREFGIAAYWHIDTSQEAGEAEKRSRNAYDDFALITSR